MPNIVVTGAQWGDEGKGKIVDLLAEKVQVVARYNGGHNAGHTVLVRGEKFVLHLLPAGILHEGVLCLLGNGLVIDPWAMEAEIAELRRRGLEVGENLVISDRAHLILPHHRRLEAMAEAARGARRIGTTQRGIGPAYEDKAGRRGLRVGDLLRPAGLPDKLAEARRHYEALCRGTGAAPELDWERLVAELAGFGARLAPRVADTSLILNQQLARGYSVLFEGAQATLLDLDLGTYPFVTSSSAAAAGAAVGLGISPTRIDGVLGVVKAYTTRVGAGPLPSELPPPLQEQIRERGAEFGASTGRPRRCAWFDAVVARYSVRVNGCDALALMKLDVLDPLPEIRICTAYRHAGETLAELPADLAVLEQCEPVYETHQGWMAPTAGLKEWRELPAAAQRYVERLAELSGAEVALVSTGPDREQTIVRGNSKVAAWFA
jgi:adenylosuccinate synthase